MTVAGELLHRFWVVIGAAGLTLQFFLVLPLIQSIGESPSADLELQSLDTAILPPPPPPPPEEEKQAEEEPEPEPPELQEEIQLLDLSQLELALDPGFGSGLFAGDFAVKLDNVMARPDQVDELFSIADLDQEPRLIYQASPVLTRKLRQKAPGSVTIRFIIDEKGAVQSASVESSSDPAFERAALAAVKQWRFEPGMRNGKPVSSRKRVPITFPKG